MKSDSDQPTDFKFHYAEFGHHAVSCLYAGKRYHLNLDFAAEREVDALYCNPPLKADGSYMRRGDDGWFHTRKLRADGETGRVLVPVLAAKAKEMYPAALEEHKAKKAMERAEWRARVKARRVTDCAERMYDLLNRAQVGILQIASLPGVNESYRSWLKDHAKLVAEINADIGVPPSLEDNQ